MDEKPSLANVRLALLTPGNSFSGAFLECFTRFHHYLVKSGIPYLHVRIGGSHVGHVRQNSLMGSSLAGPSQRCFSQTDFEYTHMLWIDSDMIFDWMDFLKLLAVDKDYVSGLFKINDGIHYSCGRWNLPYLMQNGVLPFYTEGTLPSQSDLFETEVGGLAFTLLKAGVIEKLSYPWIKPYTYNIAGCEMTAGEDISLCLQLREKGVKLFVNPLVRIGHEKLRVLS